MFGHAARCPERELIRNLLVTTPSRTWFTRTGGQLKTRATTLKEDLKPLTGPRVLEYGQWVRDWVKISSELTQDCHALIATS